MIAWLVGLALAADPALGADPAAGGTVTVTARPRSDQGRLLCSLFDQPAGFPGDPQRAVARAAAEIRDGVATCLFPAVPPGAYAVAILHDENGNLAMDTSLLGIPREGFGASRDAKPRPTGPPRFEDAVVEVGAEGAALELVLRYF
ncbi:MAG: DUF2141 domain-containing protein [Alphaproteobacteria bacterium]|nr:DUF2141 domain-containing protein [Alphaproteobacteria bacterium]